MMHAANCDGIETETEKTKITSRLRDVLIQYQNIKYRLKIGLFQLHNYI